MLQRTLLRRVITNPDLHRHAQGTFKDGHHRAAPQPSLREWADPKSPFYRGWDWVNIPVNRMSVIVAWSVAAIMSYYGFCVSYDLRGVYRQVHTLQRQLHVSHARVEDSDRRIKELTAGVEAEPSNVDSPTGAPLSHEMELTRERARVSALADRNNLLMTELATMRSELVALKDKHSKTESEVRGLRALLRKLQPVETQ